MSGPVWAVIAGVSFGLFQTMNRRANQALDAYRSTFGVLLVATIALVLVVSTTQDHSAVPASGAAVAWFAGAGLIHFATGWTLMSLSQQRIGAARTGVVVATAPLIATILAAAFLGEPLPVLTVGGVMLAGAGVTLIAAHQGRVAFATVPWLALGAAACLGTSPLFIRWGLERLGEPIVGVTIAIGTATVVAAIVVAAGVTPRSGSSLRGAVPWVVTTGCLVALAIAAQWTAFDRTRVSVAITLMQLAIPVVVVASPLVVAGEAERPTIRVALGMLAIVSGSLIVVWAAS